jgi:hypothetical protein
MSTMTVNPWDAALDLEVIRGNHLHDPEPLEPGVKFFVLELEKRGCKTIWSCEGHPHGFHVTFRGPLAVVRAIVYCGVFDIGICDPLIANGWGYTIDLSGCENRAAYWEGRPPWDDTQRREQLRKAAANWTEKLDGFIRYERDFLTPSSTFDRRLSERCPECTDPSGCRSMGWCAFEVAGDVDEEEVGG